MAIYNVVMGVLIVGLVGALIYRLTAGKKKG